MENKEIKKITAPEDRFFGFSKMLLTKISPEIQDLLNEGKYASAAVFFVTAEALLAITVLLDAVNATPLAISRGVTTTINALDNLGVKRKTK